MKRKLHLFLALFLCLFSLCSCASYGSVPNVPVTKEPTMRIQIPGSLFTFANADQDDSLKRLEPYCTDAWQEAGNLWLDVTEKQRQALIAIYQENGDTIIAKLEAENPLYSCTVSEDYQEVTYAYDENINGITQAELLLMFTVDCAMQRILERNDSDWQMTIHIVNCHTKAVVAEGTVPEDTITFDDSDWMESYK